MRISCLLSPRALALLVLGGIQVMAPRALAQTPSAGDASAAEQPEEPPASEERDAAAPEAPDAGERAPQDEEPAPAAPKEAPPSEPLEAAPAEGSEPAPAATGDLHLLVFIGALPASNVEVSIDGAPPVQTNENGSVTVSAPPGKRPVSLRFASGQLSEAQGPVTVELPAIQWVRGETVEAIATVSAAGKLEALDVEGAEARAAEMEAREEFRKAQQKKPRGTVTGQVVALETGEPIAGAKVFVRGAPVEGETDAEGRFSLELPEGEYSISVIHTDYSSDSLENVKVQGKQTTEVKVELTPASLTLDEFVVTAPHVEGGIASLISERRESSNVTDVMGAEEMSRTGASDAAGALKRVTGINIVGGKYVYVRGMGERYSATMLNGQLIPSPDPERRVIPLDLFPIQVLESVVIQKTYSPNLPAEFGGGLVQLRTRSYPDQFTAQVQAQVGMNTQTTFQNGPTYQGGKTDWLGTDDGTRALPKEVRDGGDLALGDRFTEGASKEDLAALGRKLPNNWNVYRQQMPVDRKLVLTLGDKYTIGSVPVGFLASGVYSDKYRRIVRHVARYNHSEASEGGLQEANDYRVEQLTRTIASGGVLAAGSEYLPGQSIQSTTLLLRVTDDSVALVQGYDANFGTQIHRPRLRWIERQLLTEQVTGHQTIEPLRGATIDWRYSYSTARLDDPDRREYVYQAPKGTVDDRAFDLSNEETKRNYTNLDDGMHAAGVDYTQPFPVWSDLEAKAKVGGLFVSRSRDMSILRYSYDNPGVLVPSEVQFQSPEQVYDHRNMVADGGLTLKSVTGEADTYHASQTIRGAYGMAEIPLVEPLEVMAGVRVEQSVQKVRTFKKFEEGAPTVGKLDNTDVLPGSTVTWRFTDEMTLRGGFGRTVNRPDFRELSEATFYDVTTNTKYVGNPGLKRARIDHYDARWEWYFSTDELLSAGLFYKKFDQPIEIIAIGGSEYGFSWQNATSAVNYGVEVEARRRLGWIHEALENFYLSGNVAVIQSQVDLSKTAGTQTSKHRALQGQAPYVINAQLGYDDSTDEGTGLRATLLYNITGPSIAQVGTSRAPDIKQQPYHSLDLTMAQRLPAGFTLSFKAQNLLNPEIRQLQGNKVAQRYRNGQNFVLGLAWSY